MDATPPIPLFRGEHVVASWPAHYVGAYPSDEDASPPGAPPKPAGPRLVVPPPGRPGWLAAARNALVARERWAVKGHLHLTDWRLVFATTPHWSHRLDGSLSLFLVRVQTALPASAPGARPDHRRLGLSHQGDPDRPGPVQCFVVDDRPSILGALAGCRRGLGERPAGDREEFERHVSESWWRAGLGLLSKPTRASLPGPFSTSPGHESYRGQGVEPPDFALLRERLRGVEGEGLAQLPWLFAPIAPLLPLPAAPAPPPPLVPGRPLVVGREERASDLRRGRGWG